MVPCHAGASFCGGVQGGALAVTPGPRLSKFSEDWARAYLDFYSSSKGDETSSSWGGDQAPLAALMDAHCNAHPELAANPEHIWEVTVRVPYSDNALGREHEPFFLHMPQKRRMCGYREQRLAAQAFPRPFGGIRIQVGHSQARPPPQILRQPDALSTRRAKRCVCARCLAIGVCFLALLGG